jgi:hypothetical protein
MMNVGQHTGAGHGGVGGTAGFLIFLTLEILLWLVRVAIATKGFPICGAALETGDKITVLDELRRMTTMTGIRAPANALSAFMMLFGMLAAGAAAAQDQPIKRTELLRSDLADSGKADGHLRG